MFATKVGIFLCLLVVIVTAKPEEEVHVVGGVKPVDDLKDAEEVLNSSLTKLAAGDGPYYKIGKIYSATVQVVAGSLHKIKADLVETEGGKTKQCDVSIWSRPWLPDGIEVSFECPDEPLVTKKHSA